MAHHAGCCEGDVDALIDDDTGEIYATYCPRCGKQRPYTPEPHEGEVE
jgi:hypothetical protein